MDVHPSGGNIHSPSIMCGVARPAEPIQRDAVVRTALAIIDDVGIDAFGLERLAAELNIRAPSLYYHFQGKAEILREVALRLTMDVPVPHEPPTRQWQSWFIEMTGNFRRAVLDHPLAAPLLVQYYPRRFALITYERGARILERAGIPLDQHVLIFEGLDQLTFGSALITAARRTSSDRDLYPGVDSEREPHLARIVAANELDDDALFAETIRMYLSSFRAVRQRRTEPKPAAAKPKPAAAKPKPAAAKPKPAGAKPKPAAAKAKRKTT